MDEKDLRILKTIASERINSPERIHEHTGIPKSTVHYRIEQLREKGVILNDLYEMDLSKVGLSIVLISEVYAEYEEDYHESVGERIGEIEGVNQVYFTMGDTDFIVIAHVTDRRMVEDLVESYESIDEIRRTSSKFVITTVKNESHPINDFEHETLVEAILEE
ncbi:DNA-binding transcriptional regulator, Lrp family [Halopenitus malekzadehii]|uniref:DNA-binding transcriptional regulator, Lrp family n=1 Tax=Halopenitus malekzadehii TaxID=1267564 RepID=A0A1H6I9V7_9EURY|nr:Lrp/AsnC family transcriptional regulator [Halopenitus malekzadehii]SEH43085.1 DNA-binding transcriptional regulator, Lrp family [Halopenitus malekzadehii]